MKWVYFIAGICPVRVASENDYAVFMSFLEAHGLKSILGKSREYKDWQRLAAINRLNPNLFFFEYTPEKGLTWGDDEAAAVEWYGKYLLPTDLVESTEI